MTPDIAVLQKVGFPSVENGIIDYKMRWIGHANCMENSRWQKHLFYGEFTAGGRPRHKPRRSFKDYVKKQSKGDQFGC